jgi:hypothetical protein
MPVPRLPAGTVLKGQYPSGVIDWGFGEWKIDVPQGGFGTFNLAPADAKAETAEFQFYSPRVFAGIDVYNDSSLEATVIIRCPEIREISFTIKPGQLRSLRAKWRDPSSKVRFDFKNGEGLRFDNLADFRE